MLHLAIHKIAKHTSRGISFLLVCVLSLLLSYGILTYHLSQLLTKHSVVLAEAVNRDSENVILYLNVLANAMKKIVEVGSNEKTEEAIAHTLKQFSLRGRDLNSSDHFHLSGVWWQWPNKPYRISQYGTMQEAKLSHTLSNALAKTQNIMLSSKFSEPSDVLEGITFSKSLFKGDHYLGSIMVILHVPTIIQNLQKTTVEPLAIYFLGEQASAISLSRATQRLRLLPYSLQVAYLKPRGQLLMEHGFLQYTLLFFGALTLILNLAKKHFKKELRQNALAMHHYDTNIQKLKDIARTQAEGWHRKEHENALQLQALKHREALLNAYIIASAALTQELIAAINSYGVAVGACANVNEADAAANGASQELLYHIHQKAMLMGRFELALTDIPIDIRAICDEAFNLFIDQCSIHAITVNVIYADELPFLYWEPLGLKRLMAGLLQRALADIPKKGTISLNLQAKTQPEGTGVALIITTQGLGLDDSMLQHLLNSSHLSEHLCSALAPTLDSIRKALIEVGGTLEQIHTRAEGSIFQLWIPASPKALMNGLAQKEFLEKTKEAENVVALFS